MIFRIEFCKAGKFFYHVDYNRGFGWRHVLSFKTKQEAKNFILEKKNEQS